MKMTFEGSLGIWFCYKWQFHNLLHFQDFLVARWLVQLSPNQNGSLLCMYHLHSQEFTGYPCAGTKQVWSRNLSSWVVSSTVWQTLRTLSAAGLWLCSVPWLIAGFHSFLALNQEIREGVQVSALTLLYSWPLLKLCFIHIGNMVWVTKSLGEKLLGLGVAVTWTDG